MTLRIRQVTNSRQLARFVDVPWHIYDPEAHPQWVPPLRKQVRDVLDRRNPFYRHAAIKMWIAEEEGRPVGRIAAIENRAHNEFHGDHVGFFGFFECVDRQEVADALLELAGGWLQARGLEVLRGPMSPSTNHDCGLLVDGFEHRPSFLTTWNPSYYAGLMERAGMAGVKDLVSYYLHNDEAIHPVPPIIARSAERTRERSGIAFRSIDLSRFPAEIDRIWSVYQDAWEKNWGFVPVSREEFDHIAGDLKPLLVDDLVFLAEVDGHTVGFMLILPDYNEILARIPDGRLLPTGWLKLLVGKKRVQSGRVMAAGIREAYRNSGVFTLFVDEMIRRGRAYDVRGTDASWILEDNRALRDPLERFGVEVTRRWRIYERPLDASA